MITIEDFPSLSHPKTQPHLYLTSNPTNKRLLSLCHHTPTNTRGCTASQSNHPPRQMCVTWNINFAVRHSQSVVATRCLLHLSLPPVGLWRTARTAARGVRHQRSSYRNGLHHESVRFYVRPSMDDWDLCLRLLSHSTNCVVVNKWCQLLTPNSTHRVRLTFCRMQLAVLRVASWRFIIQNIKMHKHYIYSTGVNSNVCSIVCTDFLFLDIDCCQKLSDNASTIKKFNLAMYLPLNWFWLRIFSIASVWLTELFAVLGDWDLLK